MKIRTVYFKTQDMKKAARFWEELLQIKPHKAFDEWHEFMCGSVRFGLLLCDDKTSGSNCVPVFEFKDDELKNFAERAKGLGAKMIVDGLSNSEMKVIVLADPWGNEFELTTFHD